MKQSDFHILQTIALLILAITISASAMVARPSINGKLHVEGTGLFDERGNQVVLKVTFETSSEGEFMIVTTNTGQFKVPCKVNK